MECTRKRGKDLEDNVIKSLKGGFDQTALDEANVVDFSTKYGLSNAGVEDVVNLWKDVGQGCERIEALPKTWRTLCSHVTVDFDDTTFRTYEFPVPPELDLDVDKVQFVLKSGEAILQELLCDNNTVKHGNFWFDSPPQEEGKYTAKGLHCSGDRCPTRGLEHSTR